MTVSTSTLTNEHSQNIAKSSDEHNKHSRNTSNVTDAHTSDAEHSDAELKEYCSRDPSYAIKEENINLVAKTFDGQNEHSADTLNLTKTCGTDTNDSDAELKEDQEALDHQQDLTGDALPSVVQFHNFKIVYISVLLLKIIFQNISYWMKTLKFLLSLICVHMVMVDTFLKMECKICQ